MRTASRRRMTRKACAVLLAAGVAVLSGCASSTGVAADALDSIADAYPKPENPCAGVVEFAEAMRCGVQQRINDPDGAERAAQRDAGGPAFLAELSRDDLLRYAGDNDQALQLGHEVCRLVYGGHTGAVTDLLSAAGFGDSDAALFVGAAGTTMCPGD